MRNQASSGAGKMLHCPQLYAPTLPPFLPKKEKKNTIFVSQMPIRMSESQTTAAIKDGNKGSLSWMDVLVEAAATASVENEKNKRKQKLKIKSCL